MLPQMQHGRLYPLTGSIMVDPSAAWVRNTGKLLRIASNGERIIGIRERLQNYMR